MKIYIELTSEGLVTTRNVEFNVIPEYCGDLRILHKIVEDSSKTVSFDKRITQVVVRFTDSHENIKYINDIMTLDKLKDFVKFINKIV